MMIRGTHKPPSNPPITLLNQSHSNLTALVRSLFIKTNRVLFMSAGNNFDGDIPLVAGVQAYQTGASIQEPIAFVRLDAPE